MMGVDAGLSGHKGYWRGILISYSARTRKARREQGAWFDTGDVQRMDADGYVTIRDRSRIIIKSRAGVISSVELETSRIAHPRSADACGPSERATEMDERPSPDCREGRRPGTERGDVLSI